MDNNQPVQNPGQAGGGAMPGNSETSSSMNQSSPSNNKPSKTRIITILVIIAIIAVFIYAANSGSKSDDAVDDQLNTNTGDTISQPADDVNDDIIIGQPGVKTDDKNDDKPTTTVDNQPQPVPSKVTADCVIMGCSNEICTSPDNPVFTACVYQSRFACYKTASCEKQASGVCGWTETDELTNCLIENQAVND